MGTVTGQRGARLSGVLLVQAMGAGPSGSLNHPREFDLVPHESEHQACCATNPNPSTKALLARCMLSPPPINKIASCASFVDEDRATWSGPRQPVGTGLSHGARNTSQ